MSKRTYITSLTAVNNSNIVTVNDGTDLSNINPGDDLRIDGLPGEAVKAITATQIILERPWALANKTNVKGINVPTADDFREATKILRDATVLTSSNMSAVNSWTTKMGTVQFTDPADPTVTYTVKTIRQLEQDAVVIIGSAAEDANRAESARDAAIAAQNQAEAHKNTAGVSAGNAATKASEAATSASTATTAATTATTKAAEAVVSASNALAEANRAEVEANKAAIAASALYGMSQSQFEAIRAQNNEKYAASGFVHLGKHENQSAQVNIVNQGMNTYSGLAAYANAIGLGRGTVANTAILSGKSSSRLPVVHVAGCIFTLEFLATASKNFEAALVKFPQAPDGKTTYNKSTGVITNHTTVTAAFNAQAADPTNVEVVTDRVDMWGFEAFLEEVNTTNPYVYPNGLIQSQAPGMDGITTSASARPVTYYAVFDGDTGSKGKGVNFFALTDAQKKKVLGNYKNNLYYLDDGRLVQWRLRQRTVAGAGNGDWDLIDSTARSPYNSNGYLAYNNSVYVFPCQGMRDTVVSTSFNYPLFINNTGLSDVYPNMGNGIFGAISANSVPDASSGVNGESYFLVCGTVNRLNTGAYHPTFNPSGTTQIQFVGNPAAENYWFSEYVVKVTSLLDCFLYMSTTGGGTIQNSTIFAGRPDLRFYNAIYPDGQGGVCRDMRYSAYGVDSVDFAEADQRVKNGTYRGFEKLVFTKVVGFTEAYYGSTTQRFLSGVANPESYNLGATPDIYIVYNTGEVEGPFNKCNVSGSNIILDGYKHNSSVNKGAGNVMIARNVPISVGGSFLQTDVIGNPANILATPQLANGWQGSWGGLSEAGGVDKAGTRKMITGGGVLFYTQDNGVIWNLATLAQPNPSNIITGTYNTNEIRMCLYQAFATQTENAVNAEVYGGAGGVGEVSSTSWNAVGNGMVLLAESCAGVILKSNNGYQDIDMGIVVTKNHLVYGGKLGADLNQRPEHFAITMMAPHNNSPAFKALNYDVNLNQQAFIQYAYTELKHNGTNWGDDGKVTIVDNQATKTDLNGNTVLVGTVKLKEPIGWLKVKV